MEDRFDLSFPAAVHAQPITGRIFVIVTRTDKPEPRVQLLSYGGGPPIFGKDVHELRGNQTVTIAESAAGYPLQSLKDVPEGDYYVEAFLNIYTELHRADGHTIWAHLDWAGERPSVGPGNLHSDIEKIRLDPLKGFDIRLSLSKVIPEPDAPTETQWIKVVKFQSPTLTKFWGHPMYLGATVLLPKGYDEHPNSRYPVVYYQGHFDQAIPWQFDTNPEHETAKAAAAGKVSGLGRGYEFYQAWVSDHFPRFILVSWQHPCPYFDDSYAVDSANCGPFGDAIMNELIPYVESHFRVIPQPYARVLEGGSTGGWESLALQVFHPTFFGEAWVFDPDAIDFRNFQLTNIYEEDNAFSYDSPSTWLKLEKPWSRTTQGLVRSTVRELSHYEDVLGPNGRSGVQLDGWWSIFSPVGDDGYPVPLWDMQTGQINHRIADYMRDHGFDLSYYIRTHWHEIGPDLIGKLHFFVGDMDNYYLDLAVYRMEDFLKATTDPYYGGSFVYGRPMKGHGWHPMTWADLLRDMGKHVTKDAPKNTDTAAWNY